MRTSLEGLKWQMERVLESHPYSYFLGKKSFHLLPFLLPHDKSFLGFKYLIDREDGLFLDVGANDGVSALSFRRINTTYRILSIEPNCYHVRTLERVKARIAKFDFLMLAAGEAEATNTLYTPYYRSVPLHSAASLRLDELRASVESHFSRGIARRIRYTRQDVKVVPLDSLNLRPNIIKIDAEGTDLQVLQGLRRTIGQHRPFVMVENSAATRAGLRQCCDDWSYVVVSYEHRRNTFQRDADMGVRNVFCIPVERLDWLSAAGRLS